MEEHDLEKLGSVLATANQINIDMINMLEAQQKRQARIISVSLVVVLAAFIIVGISMFMAYSAFHRVSDQLEQHIKVVQQYERTAPDSKGLSEPGNTD